MGSKSAKMKGILQNKTLSNITGVAQPHSHPQVPDHWYISLLGLEKAASNTGHLTLF